jgi:hypothetical protein
MKCIGSALVALVALATGCGSQGSGTSSPSPHVAPAGSLIGEWRWVRSCDAFVRAFREAGLADLTLEWLVDARYFAHEDQIQRGDPCAGAVEARYVYFFEESGRWGMIDDDDVLVDDRDFALVDEDAISFGDVTIDYRISPDDTLDFDVVMPGLCDATCRENHAWAVATFAPGTFRRVG